MNKVIVFLALYLTCVTYAVPVEKDSLEDYDDDFENILQPDLRSWFTLFGNFKPSKNEIDLLENDLVDLNCPELPEINKQLQGDIEKRTIALDKISKIDVDFKDNKKQTETTFKNMFQLFDFFTDKFFEKFYSQANKLKNTLKQQLKFLEYMKLIKSRVDKTLETPMGPKIVHLQFQNNTITLKSNTQIEIIRKSLKALIKCYNTMKPKIKNKSYILYAKKILNITNGYNYATLKDTIEENKIFDSFEINNRIILDAKLTEFEKDQAMHFRKFNWFSNGNDNDNKDQNFEQVYNDDASEIMFNDNLKVANNFDNFVSMIIYYIKSIKYYSIEEKCSIKGINNETSNQKEENKPQINGDRVIEKETIEILQKKAQDLEKNCKFVNSIDKCAEQLRDLDILIFNLATDTIIDKFNKAIQSAISNNLGAVISKSSNSNQMCKINDLSKSIYNLRSAAQLNIALQLLERGKQCLEFFGFKTNINTNLNKVMPNSDFNMDLITNNQFCDDIAFKIVKNVKDILQREKMFETLNGTVLSID